MAPEPILGLCRPRRGAESQLSLLTLFSSFVSLCSRWLTLPAEPRPQACFSCPASNDPQFAPSQKQLGAAISAHLAEFKPVLDKFRLCCSQRCDQLAPVPGPTTRGS